MQLRDCSVSNKIVTFTHVLASVAGIFAEDSSVVRDEKIVPIIEISSSGHVAKLEKFSHYVARQMGFEDCSEVPELCRLAHDYLKKPVECVNSIVEYLANEMEPTLSEKLIEEFEGCICSYFAFHWNHVSCMINQVMTDESPRRMHLKKVFQAVAKGTTSNHVVVEADAFKETDIIYETLKSSSPLHDMVETAELVHQSSTDAASSLLVTALNEGRDVIMDGTLSWEPFVEQTIAMARNVHKHRYRMGVGHKVADDGRVTENYWEQVTEAEKEHQSEENDNGEPQTRKPYRIELVGVVCDGYLAVVRGIRRAIRTRRAVRVNSQLKSHQRFADAFPRYCKLVDNARLYCTNAAGSSPKFIWGNNGDHNLPVHPEGIKSLEMIGSLNAEADSIYKLYKEPSPIGPGSYWNDIVLSPSRPNNQRELRESIKKIEKSIRKGDIVA